MTSPEFKRSMGRIGVREADYFPGKGRIERPRPLSGVTQFFVELARAFKAWTDDSKGQ